MASAEETINTVLQRSRLDRPLLLMIGGMVALLALGIAVALIAALVATTKPAEILPLVSASFSLAASAFVPAMLLGILWRGANRAGATAGMVAGP